MASLSSEDRAFINTQTLPATVYDFVNDFDAQAEDTASARDAISNLLAALQLHPVARRLRSYRPVNRELALISGRLDADDFNLSLFTPLTTLITDKAGDAEIWQAVLDLITSLSRTSPKQSIAPSFNGTPRTYSSASFQDSVQKRKELEESMRHELAGYTYINVGGFFAKYFENRPWSKDCGRLLARVINDMALHSFPNKAQPDEKEVWEWLDNFQKKYLTTARGVYYRTKSKAAIVDAQGQRQLDVFLKNRDASAEEPHSARDLRVVGELTKSSKDVWKKKYLQIATYVRDTFAAQPTRWFVHGFLMFGCQIELWVFDRSGAYGSETFDVRQDPERLITVIAGYAMMSDTELGVSPFVQHRKLGTFVTVTDATTSEDLDLQLEPTPFIFQPAVVSRGTTCYRTRDGKNVVKMSWRPDKLRSEIDLLTMAQGVKGIPQLVGSRDVTTIENLRSNLDIKTKRKLGDEGPQRLTNLPASSFTSQSTYAMARLDASGNKRASGSTDEPLSKKRRSSQASHLRREVKTKSETPKQSFAEIESSSSPERSSYRNRVLTCLAIAPAGRPLQHFRSVLEVLEAFRDTITAHRSLFLERNILHRDISMNNIILIDPAQNDGCTGMLIDLDLAVKVGKDGKNETSEQKTMTGTLEYMAIQILENQIAKETMGIKHTYRHDLESFFYVLLSLCTRYGWQSDAIPKSYPLRTWYEGSIQQIYRAKLGDVLTRAFETVVLKNFSPTFDSLKPLARELRNILFMKGTFYVETPKHPPIFYDLIIEAFDTAIREAKCRQRGLRSRYALKEVSYSGKVIRRKRTATKCRELNESGNMLPKRRRHV